MLQVDESDNMLHHDTRADDISSIDSNRSDAVFTSDNNIKYSSFTILPNIHLTDQLDDDVIAIWLDDTIGNSIESQWFKIAKQLRQIISHVEPFADVYKCIEYAYATGIERIFLIVAGTYGDDFDRKLFEEIIHEVSIYILTSKKFEYNPDYTSTRGSFENPVILINQIHEDYKTLTANKATEIHFIRESRNVNTTRCINPQLIQWKCWQLMADILRQMPCPREQAMKKFLQLCKFRYENNKCQLAHINEFEHTYQADTCIHWYTKDCFLYRRLNESMQTNNIDAIMNCSHILMDIYDQLNQTSCEQRDRGILPKIVYRGGRTDIDELEKLKLKIGGHITNTSILTATLGREVAELFIPGIDLLDTVVFIEVHLDWDTSYLRPFAYVSHLSLFANEEVLFTNGHVFRIDSCDLNGINKWLLKLTLCDDVNPIMQNGTDYFDIAVLQLLEILPKISPKTNKANDRMIQGWRSYCADDPIEKAKVDRFEESYRSDSAIRWYTKDSLLYRLLNAALRHDNVDMIIDFRYFIIDLYDQLTKSHLDYVRNCKERYLSVYRGQKISLMELRRLKHNIENYISIKSLFSASLSSQVALCFAELDESDRRQFLQSVLFQIDIDMEKLARSGKNHIFANIIHLSCFVDEKEVLFMANTQFRIQSVTNWDNRFWLVHLALLDHDDENNEDIRTMNRYLDHITNMITQNYGDSESIRSFFSRKLLCKTSDISSF